MNTNRQKEIKELEQIEAERRKASQKDFVITICKKIIDYIRWFFSIMFFIVSFSFFGEEDAIFKMCIGLVFAICLNPVSFRYLKSLISKEGE